LVDPRGETPVGTSEADSHEAAPPATREAFLRLALVAAILVVLGAVLDALGTMLTPFVLGAVLAYLFEPGARWLQRRLGRALACALMVLFVISAALGLVLILVPVLEREALALYDQVPALIDLVNSRVMPHLAEWLGTSTPIDFAAIKSLALQKVGQQDVLASLLSKFGSGGLALLGVVGTMLLVPIVLFYLLLDADKFTARLHRMVPPRWHGPALRIWHEIDTVLAQFLRGQLTVMALLAFYYAAALSIVGLESALAIGLITGLLIFIPYVGFAIGLLLATLVALLQSGTWQALTAVGVVYLFGNVLEGFFLTPRLVGERIGLHPLAVIFALLAFGRLFGFVGVLVALPASAVLLVALRHLHRRYLESTFYNRP
jgi:predicted PurR-regulated permease PerM